MQTSEKATHLARFTSFRASAKGAKTLRQRIEKANLTKAKNYYLLEA